MTGLRPAHCNELLLYLKEVGGVLAQSPKIQERVWGLHLLEDWKTLHLWAESLDATSGTAEAEPKVETGAEASST